MPRSVTQEIQQIQEFGGLGLCGDRGCRFQELGSCFTLLLPFLVSLRVTALHERHLFKDGSSERKECKDSSV